MQYLRHSLFAFLGIINVVFSQSANLTSDGCVDAAGFQTCQNGVTAATAACLTKADADGSSLETEACGCTDYTDNINCYAAHCWNRVNECEYQTYAVEYLVGCPIAVLPIPYFPTPANAPDSCSCNLGDVYLAITGNIQQGSTCSTNASSTAIDNASESVQQIQGCECCEISGSLSSIYSICPNTDPSLIGLSSVNQLETTLDTPFSSCGSYLAEFPCDTDLHFSAAAGGTFYGPDNLPASGTQTLSNLAGTVTAPASGAVFTYTNGADKQVYTISAASAEGAGSKATTTGKNGATTTSKSESTTATSIASTTGAQPTTTKSLSSKTESNIILLGTLIVLSFIL
ncbi:hypothetical protein D0Z07_8172 [Hyphodiscus hymeniophilus]|uniref:Uncharacterized protein n=1 Tax=Hyphodiscus hymeniophilus TaxID=353542 RepID=A0A9P6SNK6_9HELO|nr:hypothetical protein D0Z07_8172 [Hyphodiscus hymeniophilus]